jgi:hypothetical protein
MKLDKRLLIDNEPRVLSYEQVILELSAGGRATFVVQGTVTKKQLVKFDIGYQGDMRQYFYGVVTKAQPAETGYTRIMVRELSGLLAMRWPISIQHATAAQVIAQLSHDTGLNFVLPENKAYTETAIPHFVSQGSGYQVLENIGHAYSIADFCWYQQTNGDIYLGSYADSRWPSRPIKIPDALGTKQRGGNSMTLAVIPAIRPGVIANGKRLTKVEFSGHEMTLYWQSGENTPAKKRQINYLFPELAAGLHLPQLGKVMAITDCATQGDENNAFRPRFAADVQLLNEQGEYDTQVPLYKAVPLPVHFGGAEQGLLSAPAAGTIVEIAFAYGRCDRPFIRTILGHEWSLPDFKPGEQLQQQRAEVFSKTDAAGNTETQTDQHKHSHAFTELQEADNYIGSFGQHELQVNQHSKECIAGQKLIETLGSFEVMAGDDLTLGALGNMHQVTAGDMVQVIGQLRDVVIGLNDQVKVLKDRIHTIEQNDTLTVNGQQTITIKKDQVIQAKNITQDAGTIKLNGGSGVITCASICPFTGEPHVDGSTTVFAGK